MYEFDLDRFLDADPQSHPDIRNNESKVRMKECKTALSKSGLWDIEYSLNPYHGCTHRCAYCYAPSILRYPQQEWGKRVEAKLTIPTVLARELKTKKRGLVSIGSISDPYQPLEKKLCITRHCLEVLLAKQWPVLVLTKSDLVLRDIDLLRQFRDCEVEISIGTMNEGVRRILEPGAPSIERRLKAVRRLSDEGIRTCVFMGPFYPTNGLEELPEIANRVIDTGATSVVLDRLNLREGVAESTRAALKVHRDALDAFEPALSRPFSYEKYCRAAASRLRALFAGHVEFRELV